MQWLRTETAQWLGLIRGVVQQSGEQGRRVDPEAHVIVLTMLMLAVSALAPRKNPRLHARVLKAALKVMHLGSHLEAG